MIDRTAMLEIARARLDDAALLIRGNRVEGAIYLCGYAIELGLKARICQTLNWAGYPSTNAEFKNYSSFKTHALDVLLRLSGVEERITTTLLAEWSDVAAWNPESRYNPLGTATQSQAEQMINSAKSLLQNL